MVALLTAPAPELAELALVEVPVGTGVAHVAIPQNESSPEPNVSHDVSKRLAHGTTHRAWQAAPQENAAYQLALRTTVEI